MIDPHRQLTDPDNRRLAQRLRKQRAHLFRFLSMDGLDATNNQAERMLRPAVMTRKTNGCNRTARGALAHSILASVLVTCRQQGVALSDALGEIRVGQAMTRTPQTLKANDSLAKAIELTLSTSQAAFPVLEWGTNKVVGMLGEADLLKG